MSTPDDPWAQPPPGAPQPPSGPPPAPPLPGPAVYGQPAYGQPAYGQPTSPQTAYGQVYGQPAYGQPAYGQQPYPAYPPQPPKKTDTLAIVALVLAIVAIVPVAIVLAVVALSRIKRSGDGGRGLAIAALIVSAVWVVVGTIVTVIVLAFGDDITEAVETEIRYDDFISELAVDDCINYEPGLFDEENAEPVEPFIEVVDCSGEHGEEVIALPTISGDDYPGDAAVTDEAQTRCLEAFEPYVGLSYEESIYDVTYWSPTEETWDQGDRQIMCSVYDPSGPVTTLIKGSAE